MKRAYDTASLSVLFTSLSLLTVACGSSEDPASSRVKTTASGGTDTATATAGTATGSGTNAGITTSGSGVTGATTGSTAATSTTTGASATGVTSAGTTSGASGTDGSSATVTSDSTTGSGNNTGNITGGFMFDASVGPVDAGVCQQFDLAFKPQIPTVFLLVDRSGSMFDVRNDTMMNTWVPLQASILTVVMNLQDKIRFGFAAFTGEQSSGQACTMPIYNSITPALNNYTKIHDLYLGLMRPMKGETPMAQSLRMTRDILVADKAPDATGPKFILFVTDGEPDYCDDGNVLCALDSVVHALQEIQMQGYNTFIFGVPSMSNGISPETLQSFANAGGGQPVSLVYKSGQQTTPGQIYNECNMYRINTAAAPTGTLAWANEFAAPPANGATLGTYTATNGTATVYKPTAVDQTALTQKLGEALNVVKTCSFDLSDQKVQVVLDKASKGTVVLDGKTVPFDATNGWQMSSPTVLTLVGTACTTWKTTGMMISGSFPCDVITTRIN